MPITSKQRAQLRGLAMSEDTIVQVGQGGLTDNLIASVDAALQARELVKGRVLDVAVDIRRGSPTFGRHVAVELTAENHRQCFIPRGFAHGFAVLSEEAVFQYKCDNLYAPQSEGAIIWNDPAIGIDWQVPAADVILSEKDQRHPTLAEAPELFDYSVDYYA